MRWRSCSTGRSGSKGVENPAPASGGVDPETEDAARRSIPLGVRTLGRAVSLLDYEDYALAFTGVVKANATVCRCGAAARSSSPSRSRAASGSPT